MQLKEKCPQESTLHPQPVAVRALRIGVAFAAVVGLAIAALAQPPAPGAPQVGETYQKSIDRAWEKAVEGRNPMTSCAMLKGKVMGATSPEAFQALFVCNVDIPVRYFGTYLDQVEAGEKTCYNFLREISTQLSAMTASTDSLQKMADSMSADGENPEAVTNALGDAAQEAMTETGLEDPKRLVKNRLAERIRALCPNEAEGILR